MHKKNSFILMAALSVSLYEPEVTMTCLEKQTNCNGAYGASAYNTDEAKAQMRKGQWWINIANTCLNACKIEQNAGACDKSEPCDCSWR